MISLPDLEEGRLLRQIEEHEAASAMPYITSAERIGIERGIERGLREGILETLRVRFGVVPSGLEERILGVDGADRLRELHHAAVLAPGLAEFAVRLAL